MLAMRSFVLICVILVGAGINGLPTLSDQQPAPASPNLSVPQHPRQQGLRDDLPPAPEDEFVERLEKLLRSGELQKHHAVQQNELLMADKEQQSQQPCCENQLQQQQLPRNFASWSPSQALFQQIYAEGNHRENALRHQLNAPGSRIPVQSDFSTSRPVISLDPEAGNKAKFAFKPDETEFWRSNAADPAHHEQSVLENTINLLNNLPDQPLIQQQEQHEPETQNIVQELRPRLVKHLRELPVPLEYQAEKQIGSINPLPQFEYQAEKQIGSVNPLLPKRLHPSTFENVATGLGAKIYSLKNGQKEIVTYIDMPKLGVIAEEVRHPAEVQATQIVDKIPSKADVAVVDQSAVMQSPIAVESTKIQLDVGDDKTHWLQHESGKKNHDSEPETKDAAMVEDHHSEDHHAAINMGEAPKVMKLVQKPEVEEPLNENDGDPMSHFYFVGAIAGCSAAVAFGVVAAGVFWMRLKKNAKAAEDTEYPAYGVTGPGKHGGGSQDISPTSGDRKLAQSAQMYHYQHQKQQMIAMENHGNNSRRHGSTSDVEESDEEENEEGDYTVYECPGLAPTGEMEVRNPLFQDDPLTPSSPSRHVVDDYDDDAVQP
ncbi:unnamed protein product [Notodromas monacha]|uniref:Neural proliferation differentiation and control protein 1 n=1 Tax=Notodromas monacha TaxID=399045 RepID=A0A7R9GIG3_9CRUS|nr:unnamed protein product [Notodromas monacha]CAG0922564.1 unnamed protein product [Notodromas monacha]